MNSSINNIPRFGEIKTKPKIGEIRLTLDGKRRKVFDGKCWQYLCGGDINCHIQAKLACRYHKTDAPGNELPPSNQIKQAEPDDIPAHPIKRSDISLDESSPSNPIKRPKPGDTQVSSNGKRRIWRGARWHSLCQFDDCKVQAKEFCSAHQNQRMSLPNTNEIISPKSQTMSRTRSCTLNSKTENQEHQNIEPSPSIQDDTSLQLPTNKRRRFDENIFETIALSPLDKRELHTRNGRRVRCNGLIWKHLCAGKKSAFYKRKYQRQSMPVKKTDQINETDQTNSNQVVSLPSDTIDTSLQISSITQVKNMKKRKTTGDINNGEHIVPKRKTRAQRRKGSKKPIILHVEPTSDNAPITDIPEKEKLIEEPVINDSDISFSLKPNRLHTSYQSIEIPVQPSPPFSYDSSPSAILEQFGTIIKKETIVEEESLVFVPTIHTNGTESPCETLQDFLRAEEMKKKEFKLDCQRISYRLAKIQDCIGSISSMSS